MKHFSLSATVLSLLLVASFPENTVANDIARPRSIEIKGATLKIDGKLVWLGDTIEKWTGVLQSRPRCSHKTNSIKLCVWDELGLEIGTDRVDTSRVGFVNINLAFDPYIEASDRLPAAPTGLFTGELELDGFKFNAKTEFRSIGFNADRKRELTLRRTLLQQPIWSIQRRR